MTKGLMTVEKMPREDEWEGKLEVTESGKNKYYDNCGEDDYRVNDFREIN